MRIGLTGSISVGKTTLAKELGKLEQFKDYEIITERSKYLRDQGIKLNRDSTLKGQFVFAAERSLELMKEKVITDRTIYDVSAFTLSSKSISGREQRYFVELLMALREEYDIIIYVSPEGIEIEDNQVRETDPDYRNQVDQVIKLILTEYPPKKLIKVSGSVEERINIILSELNP